MALAVLQVGLLVKDQLILVGAARAGAREAAVSTDDALVRQTVIDAAPSLDGARIEVTVTREGGVGTAAVVDVAYDDLPVVPVVEWLFPASVRLTNTATMRQESA